MTRWLADRLPPLVQRDVLAFTVVALTVAASSGGLVHTAPWVSLGIVAGALAGVVSATPVRAAIAAASASAVGLLVGPPSAWATDPSAGARMLGVLLTALAAVAVALAVSALVGRRMVSGKVVVWAVVAVLLGNLVATTAWLNRMPTLSPLSGQVVPAFDEQLEGTLAPGTENTDNGLFFRVEQSVRDGEPFYRSYERRYREWAGGAAPRTVFNFRTPVLFYLWSASKLARGIVWEFEGFVIAAALALVAFLCDVVKRPFVVPAVAAIASFALYSTTSLLLFSMEPWAVMAACVSLALATASFFRERWRPYLYGSVAAAVLAVAMRETVGFIVLAGIASAALSKREERRTRLVWWGAGAAVLAVAYAVHFSSARPFIDPTSQLTQFLTGGVAYALAGLEYATDYLGAGGALPWVLAALGFLGAAVVPGRQMKVFALVATVGPLVSFALFANHAREQFQGQSLNYWGAALTPLLYACIAFAFVLLPGGATARQFSAGTDQSGALRGGTGRSRGKGRS